MGMSHFLYAGLPQMEPTRGGKGGGGTPHMNCRWKFSIKPLKETDLGVAQAFFDP